MRRVAVATALLTLTGCATITGGTSQKVAIETRKDTAAVPGASCRLSNGKGTWYLTTPGTIEIHRAYAALEIQCHKDGEENGSATIPSKTKGMAFGNAVFGGVIGAGIDMANGAAYEYPDEITVYIGPPPFKPEPGGLQGTPTAPASSSISLPPTAAVPNADEVYRRSTSAGVPVVIASHAEWDSLCRPDLLPSITIAEPPGHGRIDVREKDYVIGKSSRCQGQTAHGETVVYIPESDFHGVDHVSYQVTYHKHVNAVHHAEISVQ